MDAIGEAIMRSQQFRGPLSHEPDVRRIAGELLTAFHQGALDAHDIRTIADCLETGARKGTRTKSV
jgi:hypothetical protein